MPRRFLTETEDVTVANAATVSGWVNIPNWASFACVYFPAMDDGAIGIEVTIDGGTTNAPLLKDDGSADAVLCASGADPAFIDISDYIRALPGVEISFGTLSNVAIRFTCAAQTGAKTLKIWFKE